MRYLMKDGPVASVKELPTGLSDEEAVEQCQLEFEGRVDYSTTSTLRPDNVGDDNGF
jgi:hypothetical protein